MPQPVIVRASRPLASSRFIVIPLWLIRAAVDVDTEPPTWLPLKILTAARDLRRRKARHERALFVSEGIRAVEELVRSPLRIAGALVAPQLLDAPRGTALLARLRERGIEVQEVGAAEFASAAETESPQGVLAIAEIPDRRLAELSITNRLRLLVVDAVQDPGNLGTILRTAAALGATATLAMPGTVDLWNAKVVRSGMGAHFHHLSMACTWGELDAFRARHHVALWGADAAGVAIESLSAPDRLALAVGNEGSGLTADARGRADALVALPIAPDVESLNVAVATGIFLYQLRP